MGNRGEHTGRETENTAIPDQEILNTGIIMTATYLFFLFKTMTTILNDYDPHMMIALLFSLLLQDLFLFPYPWYYCYYF